MRNHASSPRRVSSIIVAFVVLTSVGCGDDGGGGAAGNGGSGGSVAGDPIPFALQGPHAALREDTEDFVAFFPEDLDAQDRWPALIWFNGSSGYTETNNYNPLLESIASWGIVVLGGKSGGMNPVESDQRQELVRRHEDAMDVLGGRIDLENIAVAGHSLGAFAATDVSADYKVVIAIQGGVAAPADEARPTLYMTAVNDTVILPSLVTDAFNGAQAPTWLMNHESAIHSTPRGDAGVYREPVIAFLRWQLASDPTGRDWFVGEACTVCQDAAWAYEERNGTEP